MKRALAALFALVLCAGPVSAKGLVVVETSVFDALGGFGYTAEAASYETMEGKQMALLLEIFKRGGVNYKVIPSSATKTEFVRTGQQVWNYGTTFANVESFSWVIHVGYNGGNTNGFTSSCRPESLLATGRHPTVPQLYLFAANCGTQTSAPCWATSGASITHGLLSPDFATTEAVPTLAIATASGNRTWFNAANTRRFFIRQDTPSGSRLLLQSKRNAMQDGLGSPHSQLNTGVQCTNCDSILWQDSAPDTAAIWEIPFSSDGVPAIFCNYFGASTCCDSAATSAVGCEGDPSLLLYALARLDSLTSGGVFSKTNLPLRAGIVIEGGFNRSGRRHPGGISPSDTTSLKATLDSLAALQPSPRLAVTVDVDSIASYTSEKTWWDKLPNAKFVPYTRLGRDTSVAGLSSWTFTRPVDPFGRFRARAFLGPDSSFHASGGAYVVNNQDSSLTAGVRSLFFRADSVFGRNRVSRFLVAPDDDWSPKNMRWTSQAWDSLVFALQKAGAIGVLADAQRPEGDPNRIAAANRDLVRGWVQNQGYYRSSLGGRPLKVLAHSGYPILGGHSTWMQQADASGAVDSIPPYTTGNGSGFAVMFMPSYELNRFWNQLFMNNYRDVDYMVEDAQHNAYDDVSTPKVDRFNNIMRGSIYKLHVNDLGGDPTRPARPGYWLIKSINNCMAAINEAANRTIIQLDYPENIEP